MTPAPPLRAITAMLGICFPAYKFDNRVINAFFVEVDAATNALQRHTFDWPGFFRSATL